jgi:hypothetical protein
MLRCCIVCKVEASLDRQLKYCAVCQSALYCSEACQKKDWSKHHKKICKLLNVGHGDMQVQSDTHTSKTTDSKERFEREERSLDEDDKRFFKLFEESTFEGSRVAARKMRTIAKRKIKHNQKFLLLHSLHLLIHSDLEKLSWPNSPLLVLLQFVGPNVLSGREHEPLQEGDSRLTPLHLLAHLAGPSDYSTHENQLILAKQLIEHGADVNAVSIPDGKTPLQHSCYAGVVTNLDFIELLLKKGADPNYQDHLGTIALMFTIPYAPSAAKFLLNWPTTDVNITSRSRVPFLVSVRSTITENAVALPDHPDKVEVQFLLQQWRDIEGMLVKRGAHDTGIEAIL